MEQSLWYSTLNTGNASRSHRAEVDENAIEALRHRLVDDALDLPGGYRCVLTFRTGQSFEAEVRTPGGMNLVSIGFATDPSAGAAVWDRLVAADEPQPATPWLAVRRHQGPARDAKAAGWLNDFARSLAWAFIDRHVGLRTFPH